MDSTNCNKQGAILDPYDRYRENKVLFCGSCGDIFFILYDLEDVESIRESGMCLGCIEAQFEAELMALDEMAMMAEECHRKEDEEWMRIGQKKTGD